MNSTAQLARDPQAGPTLVASRSARTAAQGAWSLTDRWAWSCGLPVSGVARAVANCIARHANDKTGLGWPGIGTIVNETGFCRTAVVKAIKELERGGHLAVSRFKVGKKNRANRYQLPAMGSAPHGLGGSSPHGPPSAPDGPPSALDALGGSALDGPELVSIESVHESVSSSSRARVFCSVCKNDWPAKYGTKCYQCRPTSETRERERVRRNEEAVDQLEQQIRESIQEEERARAWANTPEPPPDAGVTDDGVGVDGGVSADSPSDNPSVPETETRQPPETETPHEPGPNERRFNSDLASVMGKQEKNVTRSDRRRMARMVDLAAGEG